jgi:hypothetical protein
MAGPSKVPKLARISVKSSDGAPYIALTGFRPKQSVRDSLSRPLVAAILAVSNGSDWVERWKAEPYDEDNYPDDRDEYASKTHEGN